MEIGVKKTVFSPKAIIHQKFGNKACYKVEEVKEESAQNGCPGLAIPQKGPFLFRCRLELPEFTVVSDICRKKKDAEQSAAHLALKKVCFSFLLKIFVSIFPIWLNLPAVDEYVASWWMTLFFFPMIEFSNFFDLTMFLIMGNKLRWYGIDYLLILKFCWLFRLPECRYLFCVTMWGD